MNVKEYILSGILEAYALGDLTPGEREAVEKNLAVYPELREELERIENTQEKFLMSQRIAPPADLYNKVVQRIDAGQTKVVAIDRSKPWKLAAAAAITLAVVASGFAIAYRSKLRDAENALGNMIAQNQRMAQDYQQVTNRLDRMETDLRVMGNPDFRKVVMRGVKESELMASVYWNENTSEVFLTLHNMREIAGESQYQLWAIIDGKPVDAGVFDSNISGLLKMKNVAKGATTFAVTIEPRGGRPQPTMETMQVAGNVKSS